MQDHAFGIKHGPVPQQWLKENSLFICVSCCKLVSFSHANSHAKKCVAVQAHSLASATTHTTTSAVASTPPALPTLTEVLSCQCSTLKYIPRRARQLFGMVLVEAMKSIILNNNIEAWTRFLMIPKCVLPSLTRGGKKQHPIPIEQLCQDWLDGKEALLWSSTISKGKAALGHADSDGAANMHNRLKSAIYCAQQGQFSKACSALMSKEVAPKCSETFELLKSKHPFSVPPIIPGGDPSVQAAQLPCNFSIATLLRTFPKGTACGRPIWDEGATPY